MKGQLGLVYLVGAGPGDPGLITVKGQAALAKADVVVYDRLVNERLLALAPEGVELVYAGKRPGAPGPTQSTINTLLVQKAQGGKVVVRLKGGDPFVFGRGGEEAQALAEHGVRFEVIPGVTSAIAVPAYAGIPLTHRGVSSSFTVIMGREGRSSERADVPWSKLAAGAGTLVLLMGAENLGLVAKKLQAHGLSKGTPAAAIEWGTGSKQRTVVAKVGEIAEEVAKIGLAPPMVTVFGDVVRLRETIRWFDTKPLFGQRVLVTRSRNQIGALAERLEEAGAEVVAVPTIDVRPPGSWRRMDGAIRRLGEFDWIMFNSVNAVETFCGRLRHAKKDSRALAGIQICAIGAATAAALRLEGIVADYVPEQFTTEALAGGLGSGQLRGKRVLLPRADIAPKDIAEALVDRGAVTEEVTAYRTLAPKGAATKIREVLTTGAVNLVTFTSSSTVENLCGMLGSDAASLLARVQTACIGPATARTAKHLGVRVDIVAKEHTIPGLVEAIVGALPQRRD